jgi:hypothetical protein
VIDALMLLALVWVALLIPSALRSRSASPHITVGGFERAMDVLRTESRGRGGRELLVPSDAGRIVGRSPTEPGNTRSAAMPTQEDPIITRRRSRFVRSLIATGVTLVVAVVFGGWLWAAFAVVDGGTGGYVAILRHLKLQNDAARRVVRELDLTKEEAAAEPRVAVGGGQEFEHSSVRLRRWDS